MEQSKQTNMDIAKHIKKIMEQYSFEDVQKFYHELDKEILNTEMLQYMCKERDEHDLACPYCESHHVHKNGKTPQGVQRYKCHCGKTFILRYNTLMYHSHLSNEQWNTMLCSTLNNDPLAKMASLAGISVTSAFYCRHKILYVLVQIMNEDILLDEAELDETFITFEHEGYVKKGKHGISEDKIAIACAIDIHNHTVLAVAD